MDANTYGSGSEGAGQVKDTGIDYVWLTCAVLVSAVAAFLRFFWLDLKPLHHDEGVNGWFLTNLVRDGLYKYDPANYHGPTLYYIAYPFVKLFGLKTIPVRLSVAIFGVLTVVLILFLRRYIGNIGSIFAALFVALSPGMVFISRYFIHEIFFVFLSLAIVVSILFYIEKRKAGYFAIAWMVLILLVCFLPSALNLAAFLGGDKEWALWAFRAAFFIVDAVLVFFVVRMLLSWDEGRPVYLILASASAALMFATKETAFITLGTMIIACGYVWIWRGFREVETFKKYGYKGILAAHLLAAGAAFYFRDRVMDGGNWLFENFLGEGASQAPIVLYSIALLSVAAFAAWIVFLIDLRNSDGKSFDEPAALTWASFRRAAGERTDLTLTIAAAAAAFIYIGVLFFSSFFTYAEGVSKAFEAYTIWTKTGSKDHTQNGIFAYIKWGMKVESPILVLAPLGVLIAMVKAKHRFAMFTALWAMGLIAAYMIIPYKTPWLALSFLLPMCIIAGYGINELFSIKNIGASAVAAILAVGGSSVLAYQTYDLNFVRYDNEEMGYVYAHTRRGFLDLIREVDRYAEKSGKGKDATIEVVSPDYWPMTWYLNDYAHANFHGQLIDASTSEIIIAKKKDQDSAIVQRYSPHYKFAGLYPLRPGVDLVLLVRRDLADADTQEVYKVMDAQPTP